MAEYIEREALTLLTYKSGDYGHPAVVDLEDIADSPAADVVPVVHGRWVMEKVMIRSPFAKNAYCSECLEGTYYTTNYCPNCGARMDGE